MKRISIRNLIIVLLCVTIICMSLGFSITASKLEKLKNKREIFNVEFVQVIEETSVKGGLTLPTGRNKITNNGQTLNLAFNLYSPADELSYKVIIKNKGTLNAEIVDIIKSPDYVNDSKYKNLIYPVVVTTTDISGTKLASGEEKEIKITVTYKETANITNKNISYQLSLLTKSS